MASNRSRGRKWDGKSRVSNDLYRKRWNEIFAIVKEDETKKSNYRPEVVGFINFLTEEYPKAESSLHFR